MLVLYCIYKKLRNKNGEKKMTQYAVKQTKEFSEELKNVCFGKPVILKKLKEAMSVFQNDIPEKNIKAGDISIHVEDGKDEFEAVVKKHAYFHN
jgi:hypothetical protein